jgi:hypothetical protein
LGQSRNLLEHPWYEMQSHASTVCDFKVVCKCC